MKIWNDGKCPNCGKRWKYRVFYRKGGIEAIALDCHHCYTHAELDCYSPITNLNDF